MRTRYRLLLSLVLAACLISAAAPRPAAAHPMGNFSINQYSGLNIGEGTIDIDYVLDMAEIPAFQELRTIREDGSTELTDEQRDSYLSGKSSELASGLVVTLDGVQIKLEQKGSEVTFPPGAGGLPTLRLELRLSGKLPASAGKLEYRDTNFSGRVGWKEVMAVSAGGIRLSDTNVPAASTSSRLTIYPEDAASAIPTTTTAVMIIEEGTAASQGSLYGTSTAPQSGSALAWAQQRGDALTDLIQQKELPPMALLIALLVAFGLGAGHALSPGHGKTVVAAYLVGTRGTPLHAAILGLTVTLSHTIGVFLLGLVVLYASDYILPEVLYPWLTFLSGMMIVVLGLILFAQRFRTWRRAGAQSHTHDGHDHEHPHDHSHGDEHTHDHDHGHAHDHSHSHASVPHKHGLFSRPHTHVPAGNGPVSMGSLLALGITGGIIPCPSALVVLLVAMASHKIVLGLALIVAFSLGLAVVLTALGLLVVYGRHLVSRVNFSSALFTRLPMASALMVSGLGFLIAFQAFTFR